MAPSPKWTLYPPIEEPGSEQDQQYALELAHMMRVAVKCRATSRNGKQCQRYAQSFQLTCKHHGATAPRAMRNSYLRRVAAYRRWNELTEAARAEEYPCWPPGFKQGITPDEAGHRTKQNVKRAKRLSEAKRAESQKRYDAIETEARPAYVPVGARDESFPPRTTMPSYVPITVQARIDRGRYGRREIYVPRNYG